MTTIIYEPEGPAVEFIGHAGAGLYGSDPVCAALSILMYTLIAAAPGAQVYSRPGYCRVDGGNSPRRCGAPPPPSLSASRTTLRASSACKTCPRQLLPRQESPPGESSPRKGRH